MYISVALRQLATERANHQCEYCLYPRSASFLSFEMEHIIAEKHHGESIQENLALACPYCNRYMGSDIGSIDAQTGLLTPFFNPRVQAWTDHFQFDQGRILSLSAEGRVTADILQLNLAERIAERLQLFDAGILVLPGTKP